MTIEYNEEFKAFWLSKVLTKVRLSGVAKWLSVLTWNPRVLRPVRLTNLGKNLSIYLTFKTLNIQLKTGEVAVKALKWICKPLFYVIKC